MTSYSVRSRTKANRRPPKTHDPKPGRRSLASLCPGGGEDKRMRGRRGEAALTELLGEMGKLGPWDLGA
jgi:hypothetical protein